MERGAIKWFSPVKGYGFIQKSEGLDVFLHSSALQPSEDRHLYPGDVVEFDQVDGERGPKAINVRCVERIEHPDRPTPAGSGQPSENGASKRQGE